MNEAVDQADARGLTERDAALASATAAARRALQGSRSDRLLRLFDYLVERTLAGEAPTEQQIAVEAFGAARPGETGQDANVRVYIHRLRKVLDSAAADALGRRLQIPLGEYRVRLVEPVVAAGADAGRPATPAAPHGPFRRRWRLAAAALLALAAFALGWFVIARENAPLAETAAWRDFATSDRPVVLATGDYYLFARIAAAQVAPPQLEWDEAVPTREDLTILQMLDPARAGEVVDYGQQFVSAATVEALSLMRGAIARLPSLRHKAIKLVAGSQLTPEMLGTADIVYVGPIGGLPVLLRDPLSQASGFRIEPGLGGLTDLASGEHYQSDGMVLTDERIPRRDFSYLASFPGPGGNRVLIIAGLGEAGLKEAARTIGDPVRLQQISRSLAGSPQGFEMLQRVRTIRDVNVGAVPVIARPLRAAAIWDNAGNVAPYRPLAEPAPGGGTGGRSDRH